ncbi:MAG: plastocyanin/azurin family copper-binding protein [Halobacteriales archaeon]
MDRRSFLATLAAGASVSLAGCGVGGGNTPGPGDDFDVGMGASVFEPQTVTVALGESVRWRNTNSRAHTVTAYGAELPAGAAYFASGGFETEQAAREAFYERLDGTLSTGETYEHAFEVAGTYPYFCIPHERAGMVGTVVVEG